MTIDQLVNVLAEKMLSNHQAGHADHHVQEVLNIFPSLQFGMDVNPKFTAGPTGVEYTLHLNAFDLLHTELVHGWLVDPEEQEYELIKNQTYNQLINLVIEGNDAAVMLQNAAPSGSIFADHDTLSTKATQGSIVKHFLDRSGHQLTQHGLTVLHEYLRDGQMVVFFRNNHFNTLTKHDGLLYLLVTDFGYANVPTVIWEKLDVIDGDTEFVNEHFKPTSSGGNQVGSASPDALMGTNLQTQADYQLALQLSQENGHARGTQPRPGTATSTPVDTEMEAARRASLEEYNRVNPDTPIAVSLQNANITSGESYRDAFGQQMNSWSDTMRQASTSIQDVAASIFPQPTHASTGMVEAQSSGTFRESNTRLSSEESRVPARATVAMGIPANPPSQEDQDRILALRLQRQEEDQRAHQTANLSNGAGRQNHSRPRRYASRPAPPPERLIMAPTSSHSAGKDANCVIS